MSGLSEKGREAARTLGQQLDAEQFKLLDEALGLTLSGGPKP